MRKERLKTQVGIPFKRGNPGRPKGSKNKTYPFLDDMADLYQERGGIKGLRDFVKASKLNEAFFYKAIVEMAQKQLPLKTEVSGTGPDNALIIKVVHTQNGGGGNGDGGNGDKG